MIAYNQTNNFSEAEVKLVRNLCKGFLKVCFDDSAKVMELKESLKMIDITLIEEDEEKIFQCNKEMLQRHRNILLASQTGLVIVSEEFMRKQSLAVKVLSLCMIGKVLVDEIKAEKFGKIVQEGAKAGLEYAADKMKEKCEQNGRS